MYKPKESIRWRPRVTLPIRLEDQCLNAVADLLAKSANKVSTRNCREKKSIRDYLEECMAVALQKEVLNRAVEKLVGVTTTLNLADVFPPGRIAGKRIDLLGTFRYTKALRNYCISTVNTD